jgi:hypothetical protein
MDRFALQLQGLPTAIDRTIVLADLLSRRSENGTFTVGDLRSSFYSLNVPPPSNISACLGTLAKRHYVLKRPDGRWAITPRGAEAAIELGVIAAPLVAQSVDSQQGAEFAHVDHTVIPAWAAPPRWAAGIARLLERHPFDTNVFCMTRFPSEGDITDPVANAIAAAREALKHFSLTLHLASDAIIDDDLFGNVGAYMWACRYGLGFLEDRVNRGLNYNTVIELGGMSVTGRRCGVLKDRTAPPLPTDLSGHIYKSVDFDHPESVAVATAQWAEGDLGLKANT